MITIIDHASMTAFRHVDTDYEDELRAKMVKEYCTSPEWDEVRQYILNDWDLEDDDYLNVTVIDDDEFENSRWSDYEQREL